MDELLMGSYSRSAPVHGQSKTDLIVSHTSAPPSNAEFTSSAATPTKKGLEMGGDDYVLDDNGCWNKPGEALAWYRAELTRQREESAALRAFAKAVMAVWPMGDLDGGDLQDLAVKHGLLRPETRHGPCGEVCSCAEYVDAQEWTGGVVCYRKTPLLTGSNAGRRPND